MASTIQLTLFGVEGKQVAADNTNMIRQKFKKPDRLVPGIHLYLTYNEECLSSAAKSRLVRQGILELKNVTESRQEQDSNQNGGSVVTYNVTPEVVFNVMLELVREYEQKNKEGVTSDSSEKEAKIKNLIALDIIMVENMTTESEKEALRMLFKNEQGELDCGGQILDQAKFCSIRSNDIPLKGTLFDKFVEWRDDEMMKFKAPHREANWEFRHFITRCDVESIKFLLRSGISPEIGIIQEITRDSICLPKKIKGFKEIYRMLCGWYVDAEEIPRLEELVKCGCDSGRSTNMNALQYALTMQAWEMLREILHTEHVLTFTTYHDDKKTIKYDVTGFIPDTMGIRFPALPNPSGNHEMERILRNESADVIKTSKAKKRTIAPIHVSYLETIIASSATNMKKAAQMLDDPPFCFLAQDYLLFSKGINVLLFVLQAIYMLIFTWFSISHADLYDTKSSNSTGSNSNDAIDDVTARNVTDDVSSTKPSRGFLVYLLLWPALLVIFGFVQGVAMNSILKLSKFQSSLAFTFSQIPVVDCCFFVSVLLWGVSCLAPLPQTYFQSAAAALIIGWMKPLKYLSFHGRWNAFVTSLQMFIIKDVISFIFVFFFVFVGFSSAIYTLFLSELDNKRTIGDLIYVTITAVFGMGTLTEYPEDFPSADLELIICIYCATSAILVMAVIIQPNEDFLMRSSFERLQKVRLNLLKSIAWYFHLKRLFNSQDWKDKGDDSPCYDFKRLFGYKPFMSSDQNGRSFMTHAVEIKKDSEAEPGNEAASFEQLVANVDELKAMMVDIREGIDRLQAEMKHKI